MATKPERTVIHSEEQNRMVRRVAEAVAASNHAAAAEIASTALNFGMFHPTFYYARALHAQDQGRLQDALADFEEAERYLPDQAVLQNALGLCLTRLNRPDEAIEKFDAAITLSPTLAPSHYRKGWALVTSGDRAAAWRCYEKAVELNPNYAEALAGMASIAARDGDAEKARSYGERALKINPNEPTAIVAMAMADNSEGNFAAAEARLRPLLANAQTVGHTRGVALGFLGDALDGQHRYGDAFDAYVGENEEFRNLHAPRFAGQQRFAKTISEWLDYFEKADPAPWQSTTPDASKDRPREHVFLLGFMRSGTTLLEQVLATHPDLVHLEERQTFSELTDRYMDDAAGLDRLANLDEKELAEARRTYWDGVRGFGSEPKGKIFLDKQPLNNFNLPLIAKLFPDAKIIFALRDPRDVVFSCFRRHFEVNAMMFEFLKLPDAANFYDLVMRLTSVYRTKLPLHIHEHRYEDMVEDFDGRVKAVCDFIGLSWTDEMRNFGEGARTRQIRSPSAAQVRRGLYGEGAGQWRSYAKELAPILPTLQPWAERFGYSA
jgi:tetratricopeptide (TPR) repeat protein